MRFGERLAERVRAMGTCGVVGLDPFLDRVPGVVPGASRAETADVVRRFCLDVIEVTAPLLPAIKPQAAFFEVLGSAGAAALEDVVAAARDAGMLVLLDVKRGDIGSTAEAYAVATLDDDGPIGADAVTVSPYLGPESLRPFERRVPAGKGMFVLVRTSNPGAGAWQADTGVAREVADWIASTAGDDELGPIGAVVGATVPAAEVAALRQRMPRAWFLVPGFGAQGAGPDEIRPHVRADGLGALVPSSRAVLFPPSGARDADPRSAIAARAAQLAADTAIDRFFSAGV
ncbi:MAG: orotidine-5'-phosphate decarboxylase [Alphaproteobacteria bacterium]|nr:orotidine-5'-phosphate decarboxylase [Alphaproteobacteria bacterium]